MTDFLEEKRKEIDARLAELRPLVDEYSRLEQAARALAGVGTEPSSRRGSRKRATNGRRRSGSASAKRGRPPGTGKRALQAQELVSARPGITIPELAEAMDIQANYLYRVMPTLEREGKVRKQGKGWQPPSDDAPAAQADDASPVEA
ncbi:MAG: hypothetical protein WKF32_06185 [Thermoleophilaceae bacterium]